MNYICVRCNKMWSKDDGDNDPHPSGTLCQECLKESLAPIYRRRQLKEGNFDCFGKAQGYCDQKDCLYRRFCCTWEIIQ